MGEINNFDLNIFIREFGCSIYVETGTGTGNCLLHALKHEFKKYYSIDLDEDIIKNAKINFKDYNVEFINNFSHKALDDLIPTLRQDERIFFFLDAHYPEADFRDLTHLESVKKYKTEECFPLLEEIKTIKKHRDISQDCFIFDDWINYDTELKYETKLVTKETTCPEHKNLILDNFRETHNCRALFSQEGYLIAAPKQMEMAPSHIYF